MPHSDPLSICYIAPSCTHDEASHNAHLPRFLGELAKQCHLHVVIQRGSGPVEIPGARSVCVQRRGSYLQRAVELLGIASRLRRQGCRKFFVRISTSAALELGLFGRLLGFQVYYWVSGQGKDLKSPWRAGIRRRLRRELGDWLLKLNACLAYRFVTGPERMVGYFEGEYGVSSRKTIVLYNDIDAVRFRPQSYGTREAIRRELDVPPEQPVFLFVGRVSPLKGGDYLLPVARLLRERLPGATLVVVGHVHMPEVVDQADREQLDNLRFTGPVPNAQVVRYYHAADVFLMPSASEGFPRVLLEAMASGLPAVAFDVGGVRDIVGPEQQAFVVARGDVEALASQASLLVRQPELRSVLAQENLRQVERFSPERVAHMFVERIVWS